MPTPQELLERLDSRHDELIRKLDELNAEIERALAEFATSRTGPIRGTQFQVAPISADRAGPTC